MTRTLSTARAERRRHVPANLAPYVFRPGTSGNPGGRTAKYYEAQKICRDASPEASRVLVDLLKSDDDRVRLMAAREVIERAWGRPKDFDPAAEKPEDDDHFDPRKYTPEELDEIERALLLVVDPDRVRPRRGEDAQEVLPPGESRGGEEGLDPSEVG
jgi:hypothetical protein